MGSLSKLFEGRFPLSKTANEAKDSQCIGHDKIIKFQESQIISLKARYRNDNSLQRLKCSWCLLPPTLSLSSCTNLCYFGHDFRSDTFFLIIFTSCETVSVSGMTK
jgi:hypothetical protein